VPTVDDLLGLLAGLADVCTTTGRDDLAQRVTARRALLAEPIVAVVVAGEYKAGKSSLVNALVGSDLCPVDEDYATAVPTIIRYAPEAGMWLRREPPDPDEPAPEPEPVPLGTLESYVSEVANRDNHQRIRAVEIGLPSSLLRDGLVLIDTPGVGGLVSQHAVATLASLSMAHAALFVTDATQEYTAPELEFLEAARRACPEVVPVLTKVDIATDWEKILDINQTWLDRAGLTATIVPISSALSLMGRSDLEEESNIPALVDRLHQIQQDGRRMVALDAVSEVHAVTAQLAAPLRAERDAMADPTTVIVDLERAEDLGRDLASATAEWHFILDDGLSELEDKLEADLADRVRTMRRDAEQKIMRTDPAQHWDEFEAAIARRVSSEMAALTALLLDGAQPVAARIAEQFAETEATIAPSLQRSPTLTLSADVAFDPGGLDKLEWRSVLLEAGWGGLEGMSTVGSALGFATITLMNPFAMAIGVGVLIGGKTLRQGRNRERDRRRKQAVDAMARYLDDADRVADRQWRSALRRIRRELRTTYQKRADGLYRSARESLNAARRSLAADDRDRAARLEQLSDLLGRVQDLDGRAGQFAAALAERPR